jgi:hypothetical protein
MAPSKYLHVGGLVAVGFDRSGAYLLTISHSGRGVFSTETWERVARDRDLAYPVNGQGAGIGPISGQAIPVSELDSEHDICVASPCGRFELKCSSSDIEISRTGDS